MTRPRAPASARLRAGAGSWRRNEIAPDLAALQGTGAAHMSVIWPGFSWHNLRDGGSPLNQIPRRGGRFFWRQAYNATDAGARMLDVAMYDEVDEGTAMFKMPKTPPRCPAPDDSSRSMRTAKPCRRIATCG